MFAVLGLTGSVPESCSRTRIEQTTKSIGSAMDVPMPPSLERRLQTFLKSHSRQNSRNYLFANRNLRPYSVGKVTEYGLWPVQDKLGIKHSGVHAFRHTAASEMLENGASLPVVQRQLRQ
jgi:site-specific recombinase XerD